jgi:hypothetical protein
MMNVDRSETERNAEVEGARLWTRLRRQKVALAQAVNTMQQAGRDAAAAEGRADDAEDEMREMRVKLGQVAALREEEKKTRKDLRKKLQSDEKERQDLVSEADS